MNLTINSFLASVQISLFFEIPPTYKYTHFINSNHFLEPRSCTSRNLRSMAAPPVPVSSPAPPVPRSMAAPPVPKKNGMDSIFRSTPSRSSSSSSKYEALSTYTSASPVNEDSIFGSTPSSSSSGTPSHELLISQQSADGHWESGETVSKILNLSGREKEMCPEGMSEREWITLLCLIALEKYTEFEDEWKLVAKKGWRWLRGCKLSVNLEDVTEIARTALK